MSAAFPPLAETLRAQAGLLAELVVLAQAENDALVALDHDALRDAIAGQEDRLARLSRLDAERETHALSLLRQCGLPGTPSLLQMCDVLPEAQASEGRALHAELRSLTLQLAERNRENDVLLRQALHHAQHSIALLTGIARQEERSDTYGPAGHGGRRAGTSVLDRRA